MAASVQSWQFVHSATSMIMFHFFIAPLSESVGWATARNGYRTISYFPAPLPTICTSALLVALMVGKGARDLSQSQLGALRLCPPYASTNHFAGTSCASRSVRLISASFCMAAKVSDTCSVRRSHSSISTSALAPASACVDLVCDLCGVSRLRQPPRSTDLPGSPIGSYTADDS